LQAISDQKILVPSSTRSIFVKIVIKSGRAHIEGANRGAGQLKAVASTPVLTLPVTSPTLTLTVSSIDVRGVFKMNGDEDEAATAVGSCCSSSSETESSCEGFEKKNSHN
jgi:hypothetical protein